jgi:hypothetical protein
VIAAPEDSFNERAESQCAQGASGLQEGSDHRSLAFAAHLRAHVLSDEEVVLLSERERFALNGRVYVALAPLLDGSHSAEELVVTLAGEHSPAVIHFALMRLQEPGYVVEAGVVGARPPRAKNPATPARVCGATHHRARQQPAPGDRAWTAGVLGASSREDRPPGRGT